MERLYTETRDPYELYARDQDYHLLAQALTKLPSRTLLVLRCRSESMTWKAIGARIHRTPTCVSKIYNGALRRLGRDMQTHHPETDEWAERAAHLGWGRVARERRERYAWMKANAARVARGAGRSA